MARAMAAMGVAPQHIAAQLGVEFGALMAGHGGELELAAVEANSKVAQALFQMATRQNNVAAAIFWMKARSGWREKVEIKAPVDDLSHMTDAELHAEIRRLEREIKTVQVVLVDETAAGQEERL